MSKWLLCIYSVWALIFQSDFQAPLRYLIGQFHVNFSMVWDKARQLIASHAQALDREVFWEIYLEQLKLAAQQSGRPRIFPYAAGN